MFNRIIQLSMIGLLSLGVLARANGAEKLPPLDRAAADKVSYRKDVRPILKRHCWGCHSGADPKGGLSVDGVADMLKGGDGGPLFVVGAPDKSLLIESVLGDQPEMPKKQPPLSAAKIHVLRQWVLAGGQDDSLPGDEVFKVHIPDVYQFAPAVTSVSLSPDGKRVAAACRSEVVLFDVEGDAPPQRIATECDLITHVEFSPDGKLLAAAGGSPGRHGEVRFLNAADGKLVSSRRIGRDTLFRGN
ncbi:MAG: hypothetical protein N2C14_10695, partial [Planctomycetales bacterium]